ncbi:tandem-type lipoprotein [Staphylococcus agnetis]|uniref:tandem-type lipoprotein n=1 Tax=Staphylococcus agnetis TaxID=985762 RepID=UPI0004E2EA9E|nr:tandem-type lipoprotein [Staphylococcus agnetis]KFE42091.1 lipoprotein [Staphylococcus agnetis]NJH65708.1 tandem-type lipoprotein [Staphylococcus agnetis]NJH96885.1 tandem-type lipoprotein [Staphylococcus agnetis]PTH47775.1 tandem-type lipoprotein [Staphylococcus agnetis]PTH74525.1 tandem-type lipoprotein [Staphylococcus agnetis]
MKLARKIIIIAGVMMSIGLLSSCDFTTRQKIESGLKEPLSVYPTKNLEDFYDKEGYRDSNFSKDDKGIWMLISVLSKRNEEGKIKREGVKLYIDRNTRTSEGYYYVDISSKDGGKNYRKEYPLKMKDNQLILKDKNVDEDIQRKVKDFKFFVQFGNLSDLDRYKEKDASYNSSAPNYLISYHLNQNDDNLKEIQKLYSIEAGKNPELKIYGDGDFKSDTFKSNTVNYKLNGKVGRLYNSVVSYKPKRGLIHE